MTSGRTRPLSCARRTGAVLVGATLLILAPALAGCGKERTPSADRPPAAASRPGQVTTPTAPAPTSRASAVPPAPGAATGAQGAGGAAPEEESGDVDLAPHYAENHAFQQPRELSPAQRADADAQAERIKAALTPVADDPHTTASGVRKVLTGLGYAARTVTTASLGVGDSYLIDHGPICLEGVVYVSTDGRRGQVTAEAHGRYIEGTGCVKPEGGH
ncbi:hypothetical protein ACFVXE_17960 [Streptomyces sp. NPDC058231]|uniref:hypothetical protein n=1 Tax=Streptomyces sp. NPDC058231 TaxID=3346392 RepID=UPI0036E19D06